MSDNGRFRNLTFNSFKALAQDDQLSCYEKIGFPDSYRRDKEHDIFNDCLVKLSNLTKKKQCVVEIGPGCSELPHMLIELCEKNQHQLILIDSEEMLEQLPNKPFIKKITGFYPNECIDILTELKHRVDVIIAYSVIQYVFAEANLFSFIDFSSELLAAQGQMLIGDIPNISKRKRFLSSDSGIRYHQEHYDATKLPSVEHYKIEHNQIDDAIVLAMTLRCRMAGLDAYIVPQATTLPMANRREDLLIIKP